MKLRILLFFIIYLIIVTNTYSQKSGRKFTVTGYVKDSENNPVAGAMILVDSKNTGKVTDASGFYKIKVKPDADVITIFTMYGSSLETSVDGRTSINFILGDSAPVQNEVKNKKVPDDVVDIGYGVARKDDLAQPVSKIDATGKNYSSYSDIYDLLRGAVPGLQVVGKKIIIRGIATNSSNSDPLFVVDGNIMETVDNIHPSTVKSIQVLKDASAAIYGVSGANGVILINTIKAGDR